MSDTGEPGNGSGSKRNLFLYVGIDREGMLGWRRTDPIFRDRTEAGQRWAEHLL